MDRACGEWGGFMASTRLDAQSVEGDDSVDTLLARADAALYAAKAAGRNRVVARSD